MILQPGRLCGSMPPLITPFLDGSIDVDAWVRLVDWHIDEGSHGVVVGSSTGEAGSLTSGERRHLAETAVAAADGRIEVIVATGSCDVDDAVELVIHATGIGADAVIVEAPGDSAGPSTGRGAAILGDLIHIAAETHLPVLLRLAPRDRRGGGRSVDMSMLVELAMSAPNFAGLHWPSSDLDVVTEALLTFGPDFRILAGPESYAMLALGAHGAINGIANVVPGRLASLYFAVAKDGFSEGLAWHHGLFELTRAVGNGDDPRPLKYLMWRLGLLGHAEHRMPEAALDRVTTGRLDGVLAALRPSVGSHRRRTG